jgi:ribosomal protein S24E
MEIKEISKIENQLLERVELLINFDVGISPTVKKKEVMAYVLKQYKTKEELIIINKIGTSFKSGVCEANVYIYKNKEVLDKLTPKHIGERMKKLNPKVEEEKTEEEVKK